MPDAAGCDVFPGFTLPDILRLRSGSGMKDLRYVSEKEKYQRKKNEIRPRKG